ncbi:MULTISPECIES: hypothetical protein [unclassified Paenibacillus]|uniref:hypothetical protein n=1 Tax=unclassified Paenibacillus TaxID=185978 RepID=UPI0010460B8E|nr:MULTISPECIES: hypothetical protein [unclassified Paenibacillus]NIK67823.1 hypothetical protein [Paenibacillus sp. BK720]TCN01864.1 hypothetical protein EV294_1011325 [Paenibacillus sp. BK033]
MRVKENLIGAAIAFVLICGAGAIGANYVLKAMGGGDKAEASDPAETTTKAEPIHVPQVDFAANSAEGRAVTKIKEYHSTFDLKVTGGGLDNFKSDNKTAWDEFLASEVFDTKNYEEIGKTLASVQGLQLDMNTLIALADIARKKHDPEALRFMHRILHDLDLYAFPNKDTVQRDYWGVTDTVPSGDHANRDEMDNYLAANKK